MNKHGTYTICPKCGCIDIDKDTCRLCNSTMIHTNKAIFNNILSVDLNNKFEELYNNYVTKSAIFNKELFLQAQLINKASAFYLSNEGFGRIYVCPKCGKVPRNHNTDRCDYCGYELIATTNRGYSLLTGFLGSNKKSMYVKVVGINGSLVRISVNILLITCL